MPARSRIIIRSLRCCPPASTLPRGIERALKLMKPNSKTTCDLLHRRARFREQTGTFSAPLTRPRNCLTLDGIRIPLSCQALLVAIGQVSEPCAALILLVIALAPVVTTPQMARCLKALANARNSKNLAQVFGVCTLFFCLRTRPMSNEHSTANTERKPSLEILAETSVTAS